MWTQGIPYTGFPATDLLLFFGGLLVAGLIIGAFIGCLRC